ncbi:sulfatase family protein [Ruania alba]|uniref:Sulfatase n=1 Tax=Ruania alba TaxID=648782 RepID=A0A1H5B5Q8_9MICO|nr:sulfatase-like hydrolase/transferase [Ruania alba]SED49727.1 Sulfatase [Ruania alba]
MSHELSATAGDHAGDARPNILLITTDQQHHSALGSVTPMLDTPNIDSIGTDGVTVDRAYCNNPLCSPSRSSIITGEYPSWHGCWTIGTKLEEERTFLGDLLGQAGYQTSLIGKAHFQPLASTPEQTSLEAQPTLRDLDFWREFHGPYYGFDHIELARNHADESHVGQHYAIWMEEQGLTDWADYFQSWPEVRGDERQHSWDLPAEYHYSTWTAERTIAAIDRAADTDDPFFTWASFHDPHPPYLVPEPYASMYDPAEVEPGRLEPGELEKMAPWFALTQQHDPNFSPWQETPHQNHGFHSHLTDEDKLRKDIAVYYGMMTLIDDQVGRILDHLASRGLAENTLVIFTSDHGHFLGQHGLVAKGAFHYEDLLRVPFLARWPQRIPAGSRTSSLLGLIDLAPTMLTAAGLDVPGSTQGVNQLDVWTGEHDTARDHVIVENRHQPTAVDLRTYIDGRYKLTVYRGHPWGDLFDLHTDPGEVNNLFDHPDHQDLRHQLALRAIDTELARQPTTYQRIARA